MVVMEACVIIILLAFLQTFSAQTTIRGLYPPVTELSKFKSVTASSTCGLNNVRMAYCMSSTNNVTLTTCTQLSCLLDCCSSCGKTKPNNLNLLSGTLVQITQSSDVRAGSTVGSQSSSFRAGSYATYSTLAAANVPQQGFSISAWVKQQNGNIGYDLSFFSKEKFRLCSLLLFTMFRPLTLQLICLQCLLLGLL